MPTNMKALPMKVKTRNFIAEYCLRPLPHLEMRKYIGRSSSSQKMKNRIKSRDTNTPMTAVWSSSSHMKYSLTWSLMPCQEAKTAHMPRRAVSSTRGILRPSTPRWYWMFRAGIQSS